MNKLKTSDINLANYEAVYDYIQDKPINPKATAMARLIVSKIYKPTVTMSDSTREHIEVQLEHGIPMLFASNHVRYIDHLVGFSALDNTFDGVGDTNILGKAEYLQSLIKRMLSEPFGTLPVWREKDLPIGEEQEHMEYFKKAGLRLINVAVKKAKNGNNIFGFPEGTRNDNPYRLLKVEKGMAKMAYKLWVEENIDVSMIPTGTYYDLSQPLSNWRHPNVHFGEPITRSENPRENSISAINSRLTKGLQESVDEARRASIKIAA